MRPKRGPLDPTKEGMKREALQQFLNSTDLVPMAIHSPLSNNCYRGTRLETPGSDGHGNDREDQVFLLRVARNPQIPATKGFQGSP